MILMWIGNLIFLFVVIPAVVIILQRVVRPAIEIRTYADDINEHVTQFAPHLGALGDLTTTRELAREVNTGLERYARALDRIG